MWRKEGLVERGAAAVTLESFRPGSGFPGSATRLQGVGPGLARLGERTYQHVATHTLHMLYLYYDLSQEEGCPSGEQWLPGPARMTLFQRHFSLSISLSILRVSFR